MCVVGVWLNVLAAIDVDFGAIDVRRFVRAQKPYRARHFQSGAQALHRHQIIDDFFGAW